MKTLAITALSIVLWANICAQDFKINRIELLNQSVIVHYDLLDSVVGRTYTVSIYASVDNFINPLKAVSGDIGVDVQPGKNKKIIWEAKRDLKENFNGDVALEVRGKLYIPFIRFSDFDHKVIKRLKTYKIKWSGGTDQTVLNIDIVRDKKSEASFSGISNINRYYQMRLPKNVKPGDNYRIKVTDAKNEDDVVHSAPFKVKRKTPLVLKIVAVGIVGYLSTLIGDDDSKEIPDPFAPK